MVKIPKFYFRRYRSNENTIEHIEVCDHKEEGFKLHPAFDRPDGERDYIYVGAYKTNNKGKNSLSGAMILNGEGSDYIAQSLSKRRQYAKEKGNGWNVLDISTLSAIQMLITVEFATNYLQEVIGFGRQNTIYNSVVYTGTCDNVPNLTGQPSGASGEVDVVWRGIEGLWSDYRECIDGIYYDTNNERFYICNDPSKYNDNCIDYVQISYSISKNMNGYQVTELGLDDMYSHIMLPSNAVRDGTNKLLDKYYCTTTNISNSGNYCVVWCSKRESRQYNNVFSISVELVPDTYGTGNSSRLLYLP